LFRFGGLNGDLDGAYNPRPAFREPRGELEGALTVPESLVAEAELLQRLKAHAAANGKRLRVWRDDDGWWKAAVVAMQTGNTEKTTGMVGAETALDAALAVWSEGVDFYL
jgi:hypothetical protein